MRRAQWWTHTVGTYLAAQRREAERQAREQARLAKEQERARREAYLAAQQQIADDRTAALDRRVRELEAVLTSALGLTPVTFVVLMAPTVPARFDSGALEVFAPPPAWVDFAPPAPVGFSRLIGGNARHERAVENAKAGFDVAMATHQRAEADRQRALADAHAAYDRQVSADQQRIRETRERQAAFLAGDPEAVEWFTGCVLDASRYPDGFPNEYQVAYRPENRDVIVEFELPPKRVVPEDRGWRYIKARDALEPLARPQAETRTCSACPRSAGRSRTWC